MGREDENRRDEAQTIGKHINSRKGVCNRKNNERLVEEESKTSLAFTPGEMSGHTFRKKQTTLRAEETIVVEKLS